MRWKGQIEMSDVKVHGWVAITDDFELMLISALRYAIGRESYMPSVTINYIHYLIPQLSANTLYVMQRDIRETITNYGRIKSKLYMEVEWIGLEAELRKEYEKKKAVQK